ncbi:MAG: hypothetical protein QF659_05880, partial [Dehalococcoidia bacterium]|nr:hypothetical protein [Dehalococcoidia bacterium]
MAWQDTLRELRDELAEVRAERRRQADTEVVELQKARKELSDEAGSLGVSEMLSEMNTTLLDGKADLETVVSWDTGEDDAEDDQESEEAPAEAQDEDTAGDEEAKADDGEAKAKEIEAESEKIKETIEEERDKFESDVEAQIDELE